MTHLIPIPELKTSLGMMPCPGSRSRSMEEDIDHVANVLGGKILVTLLEPSDFVSQLADTAREYNMCWIHLPIVDFDVPKDDFEDAWVLGGQKIVNELRNGRKVVIHCMGGKGRSGLVAAIVLRELNPSLSGDEAIKLVRRYNSHAIETKEQEQYVIDYKPHFQV